MRTCELAMSGEVKTQNAPFLLRACIANRRHGAAGVEVRAPALGRGQRALPEQHDRAHGRPGEAAQPARDVADVQAFFAEHPIPQAAKTLEQMLERQRVNAALREREADRLVPQLS